MSTKVSQVWFGEQERLFSTPILALAPILGALAGQGLAPVIVQNDAAKIPLLNIILPSLGKLNIKFVCMKKIIFPIIFQVFVGTLMSWTILQRAEPPTPPSRSAELLLQQPHMTLKKLGDNIKAVQFSTFMATMHREKIVIAF